MAHTNNPGGYSNRRKDLPGGNIALINPLDCHVFLDDFDRFVAADWTVTTTEAGTGNATEALTNERHGVLLITNDDADDDADFFQKVGESFKLTSGKKTYFEARLKVSEATQSDFIMGLAITDTSPLDASDGVFFRKDDGDANLDFVVVKNSTASTATAVTTVSADTYIKVHFMYDGKSKVLYGTNDAWLGSLATTNLPDDEELTITFGLQNGSAGAKTMSIDYIYVNEER